MAPWSGATLIINKPRQPAIRLKNARIPIRIRSYRTTSTLLVAIQTRKALTWASGQRTKWTASVFSSGHQVGCTSATGSTTTRTEWEFSVSRVEMSTQESSAVTNARAMGITNGQTIVSSKAGGSITNSTA